MTTQTEAFTGEPGAVLAAAKEIATNRGWKVTTETGNQLEIKTKVSAKSWGETIRVRVDWNQVASGTLMVTVSSSARFQVYDWGKSADNVSVMMTGLKQSLQSLQSPPVMPTVAQTQGVKFCANCGAKIGAAMQFCTRCGQKTD